MQDIVSEVETEDLVSLVEENTSEEIVQNKIETIRKRLALKGLIIDGDSFYRDWQLPLALKKYQDFYKKNNNDDLIKEKIANTYFEMKKYASALNYYQRINLLSNEASKKMNLTYWYTTDLSNTWSISSLITSLKEIHKDNDEIEFYNTNSLYCLTDFHECKVAFDKHFTTTASQANQTDGGYEVIGEEETQETLPNISHNELKNIKEAIETYRNFQLDDVTLKDTYIVAAYFWDEMYNLAIELWEQILAERPDYKPVLKIVAQSYFELWEYEPARTALGKYYEIDDEDPAVAYMLGVINTKLRDYVLSNIYFSKALSLWYTPSTNVYRQLVHNYYTLENEEKIRATFVDMVKFDTGITDLDLSLAIYYHILWEDYSTALQWSQLWQEIFPENTDFYGYEWWIYREQWNFEKAKLTLGKWLELDSENPFIIINLWYLQLSQGNPWAALVYFKKVASNYSGTEFEIMAQREIDSLSKK